MVQSRENWANQNVYMYMMYWINDHKHYSALNISGFFRWHNTKKGRWVILSIMTYKCVIFFDNLASTN